MRLQQVRSERRVRVRVQNSSAGRPNSTQLREPGATFRQLARNARPQPCEQVNYQTARAEPYVWLVYITILHNLNAHTHSLMLLIKIYLQQLRRRTYHHISMRRCYNYKPVYLLIRLPNPRWRQFHRLLLTANRLPATSHYFFLNEGSNIAGR